MKIQGGLGNQLFQYALGTGISLRNKVSVKYDFSYFQQKENNEVTLWPYELPKLGIEIPKAKKIEILPFLVGERMGNKKLAIYDERKLSDSEKNQIPLLKNGYLIGYWQSVDYFQDYASEIIESITSGVVLNVRNLNCVKRMTNVDSVSIHIRRGDYLNARVKKFLKDPLDYYRKAIEHINNKIKNPHFFIFSDDLEWVKANLKIENSPVNYMSFNQGSDSLFDMILMSKCNHNIIANSSFSWWGAYLNSNSEKIVIAPKDWVFEKTKQLSNLKWTPL